MLAGVLKIFSYLSTHNGQVVVPGELLQEHLKALQCSDLNFDLMLTKSTRLLSNGLA